MTVREVEHLSRRVSELERILCNLEEKVERDKLRVLTLEDKCKFLEGWLEDVAGELKRSKRNE